MVGSSTASPEITGWQKNVSIWDFISLFPGTITFKNAEEFQEIVRKLPLESLLVETDAPFLAPVPFRGKRNEPSFVRYTAQKIAELKKVPFEKVAEVTTANALTVFKLKNSILIFPPLCLSASEGEMRIKVGKSIIESAS